MGRFASIVEGLRSVNEGLDGAISRARTAQTEMAGARSEVDALGKAIDAGKGKAEEFSARTERLRGDVARGKESIDLLDRLFAANEETSNNWSEKVQKYIESARIGAIDINKLTTDLGDASIVIDGKLQRIRDLFSGADLDKYRQKIQEVVVDISRGGTQLGEVISFIEERAGTLVKGLLNMLKLFQQGKASLEDVQRALQAARETFPQGSEFLGLIDGLEQGILAGTLT